MREQDNTKNKNSRKLKYTDSMSPVRHSDIPPTDTKKLESDQINTGASSPQLSHLVWKDAAWQGGFWFLLLFAALGLLFFFIGLQKPVEVLAVAEGGAGLVLFLFLAFLVSKHGRGDIRLGFDWDTNTLWVVRGGKTHYLPHANCIRTLEIQKEAPGSLPGAVVIGENVLPVGGGNVTFRLAAEYSSSKLKACQGTEFQKKKEARAVLKKSKMLFDL